MMADFQDGLISRIFFVFSSCFLQVCRQKRKIRKISPISCAGSLKFPSSRILRGIPHWLRKTADGPIIMTSMIERVGRTTFA